jgi:hypothetical protein
MKKIRAVLIPNRIYRLKIKNCKQKYIWKENLLNQNSKEEWLLR